MDQIPSHIMAQLLNWKRFQARLDINRMMQSRRTDHDSSFINPGMMMRIIDSYLMLSNIGISGQKVVFMILKGD